MGSRLTGAGREQVYVAAKKWVDAVLRNDDSLFTPGKLVWTAKTLGKLREKYLERPEEGTGNFMQRLRTQLEGSTVEAYQLMAEALYVHFLITDKGMSRATKVSRINEVLGWSPNPSTMPEEAVEELGIGLMGTGQSFNNHRPYHVGFILEFVEHWKQQPANKQQSLLDDPYIFKDFLWQTPLTSELMKNHTNKPTSQKHALLHLAFPDTFESIVSADHKQKIVLAFADLVDEPTQDVDWQLQQIRPKFEAKYGSSNHLFYRGEIKSRWDPSIADPWSQFVKRARNYVDSGKLEEEETNYKLEISRQLAEAREAVRKAGEHGGTDWRRLLATALAARPGSLINWRNVQKLNEWCREDPTAALGALQAVWSQDTDSVLERIRNFSSWLPSSLISGVGVRANIASVLLMGLNAAQYPPFMVTIFDKAYALTEYEKPAPSSEEGELYDHAMNFLDRFIAEAANRDLAIQNRLDAQSLVWAVVTNPGDGDGDDDGGSEDDPPSNNLASLATNLYLPENFLQEIVQLLSEKKQVIFQGPPGTGKTFLARELAACLAGSSERVTLVQFHPSYAYEDFVQGFRPKRDGEGFELRDGPLLQAAKAAQKDLHATEKAGQEADSANRHYLIIDEINRGNLGKVFGELYFLLEYRNEGIHLQYHQEGDPPFKMPKNLYIIGTMNTADRSIALVDLALRRRFSFMDFHPDEEPVKCVLRKWLRRNVPNMEWVADLVEAANEKLKDDRHAAIGPSYFMRPGLDDAAVERIWKHSVLPYLAERFFGDHDRLADFALDKFEAWTSRTGGGASASDVNGGEHGDTEQDGGEL